MIELFLILLAILGGIVSFLSPCNVGTLPSFVSYIGSQVNTTRKSIFMSLVFSLGFCLMFSIIATIIIIISGFIGFSFWFILFSGLLVISLACYIIFQRFFLDYSVNENDFKRDETKQLNQDPVFNDKIRKFEGYSGAFLLGFSQGFVWISCITPIFLAIVVIISNLGNIFLALIIFFFFALGIMVPFLIIGASIGKFKQRFFVKLIKIGSKLQVIFALVLIYIGIELTLTAFGIPGLIPFI